MKARLESGGHWRCWIAEDDDGLVGNLWVQIIEKIPNPTSEPAHHAYITNFYVREDWRSLGVGSQLLSAAFAWIQMKETHAVLLWPSERSRPLYLRHGFSVRDDLLEKLIWTGADEPPSQ